VITRAEARHPDNGDLVANKSARFQIATQEPAPTGAKKQTVIRRTESETVWRRLIREPLVHFVLIGAALTASLAAYHNFMTERRIVMTHERVNELSNGYVLQFGAPPDHKALQALIAQDIHNEILFRQGLALGLDKGDEIVRRRVIQKMRFLSQDMGLPPEPSTEELKAYFESQSDRYRLPVRVTFSHIFFSPNEGGFERAHDRAMKVLNALNDKTGRAPALGDVFSDSYDYTNYDVGQLSRLFGTTQIVGALLHEKLEHWGGPVRSAYGWHLVRIEARSASRLPELKTIEARVRTDYLMAAQGLANRAAFSRLASQYTVVRPDLTK